MLTPLIDFPLSCNKFCCFTQTQHPFFICPLRFLAYALLFSSRSGNSSSRLGRNCCLFLPPLLFSFLPRLLFSCFQALLVLPGCCSCCFFFLAALSCLLRLLPAFFCQFLFLHLTRSFFLFALLLKLKRLGILLVAVV